MLAGQIENANIRRLGRHRRGEVGWRGHGWNINGTSDSGRSADVRYDHTIIS
jgi:hypothetical protein